VILALFVVYGDAVAQTAVILKAGEVYRHRMVHRFSLV